MNENFFYHARSFGFTLIELLVVLAVVGTLASIVLASVNRARGRSYIARAQTDLYNIRTAIGFLENDTGEDPKHFSLGPCVQTAAANEVFLNIPEAGIEATDGTFLNWNGPYLKDGVPNDPWAQAYIFDTDYTCTTGVMGCENIPDGTQVRAIHSGGPNGSGINVYDSDNIVLVLCR